jgi:oxygen-independent coproporphyrinogen-3 oxidase
MQSASPEELRLLEREHDYPGVIQALSWARAAGFENINLDLIFGLPYQNLESWQRNLRLAIDLHPEHLSLYALTLEHGTPMQHWVARGLLSEPDPDLVAEMYEWASEYLEVSGYLQYEISNWARRDAQVALLACRHNLQYWRCLPYLGFGAGAHGYASNFRIANVLSPQIYIDRFRTLHPSPFTLQPEFPLTPVTAHKESVDRQAEMGEVMMMGLRLTGEGVSQATFKKRFGEDLEAIYGRQIERMVASGLLEWGGEGKDVIRLTSRGRLLGNRVFVEFV